MINIGAVAARVATIAAVRFRASGAGEFAASTAACAGGTPVVCKSGLFAVASRCTAQVWPEPGACATREPFATVSPLPSTDTETRPTSGSERSRGVVLGASFLEFVALTGVLFAQPIFDLLEKNAGLFILWKLNGLQLVAFTIVIVVAPAAALLVVETLAAFVVPRARGAVHAVLVAIVVFAIAAVVLKKVTSLGPTALLVSAAPLATIALFALVRLEIVRVWLRYLALAPAIFAIMFAGLSPANHIAFGQSTAIAHVQPSNPVRVVMIVLDEFPLTSILDGHGHIDSQMFPNLAALAQGANWYRNDTTVAPFTDAAVPAILTGRYPANQHRLPYVSDYPQNLFTLLGNSYEMNVHETITRLCPKQLCSAPRKLVTGAHPGLGGALGDTLSIWRDFASPARTNAFSLDNQIAIDLHPEDTAQQFVKSLTASSGPRLDFLHLLMPHFPWHYLPTGQDYAALPGYTNGLVDQRWSNTWVGQLSYQRHLLQAEAADAVVGEVVQRLREIGAYDNSMIVVTADHGASFVADQPFRGVAPATYPNIMWTPLFVKLPQQRTGVVDDRPARSIDILPTIADVLGIKMPWAVDGRSLLGPAVPDGPRRLLEWDRNAVKPPPGQHYIDFDGPSGFATVLRARAFPPDADAALRLYRLGPFGGLIGKPAAGLVEPASLPPTAKIDAPLRYQLVDPNAANVPWTQIHGTINVAQSGRTLAFALNGVVAGVYETYGTGAHGRTDFWGLIPPTLLHAGHNSLALYTLDGTPDAPILRPAILK